MDTQADISIFREDSINVNYSLDTSEIVNIKGITNDSIGSLGTVTTNLFVNNNVLPCKFHIVSSEFDIPADGILGKDFIKNYSCILNYDEMSLTINGFNGNFKIPIRGGPSDNTIVLPARSEVVRQFNFHTKHDSIILDQEIAPGILIPRTIIASESPLLRVMNTTAQTQIIQKNTSLKSVSLSEYSIYNVNEINSKTNRTRKLLKLLKKRVNPSAEKQLLSLCGQFADIFALEDDPMSVNNFYKQKLRVRDNDPVYTKNYRLPNSQKEEINKQVDNLLKNNLIEPSQSDYNSPVILVPKKGGKWRMCIDYRLVNKKLIADKYPLPRIEEILDSLGRTKYFSVLDLYSGFHQVPLDENSRDITSFSTPSGSFRWKVLPFGLNVSPNSFSRMMALAFAGASTIKCFLYMDDIIVIGCSERHHLNNLKAVFEICRKFNLKLNPEKCEFFRTEVTYLGHKCTDKGIFPDDSKIDTVKNYPVPSNKDEVKRFVAFMNYYRRFIPNFAGLARPLNSLTRRKSLFLWTQECQDSFNELKQTIIRPPILQYPDFSREFTLTVDASKNAVGAVLTQEYNGMDLPISYASRSFTKGELNKSTIEKELAAIHFAIKHFRPYIYGTHFTIKSDHRPLSYLFSMKDPSSKLTRMRLEIEEYNFTVEYIKGKLNVVADALSRITIQELKLLNQKTSQILAITRSMSKKLQNEVSKNQVTVEEKNEKINIKAYEDKNDRNIPIIVTDYKNHMVLKVLSKKKQIIKIDASKIAVNERPTLERALFWLEKEADSLNINKLRISNTDKIFTSYSINQFKCICNQTLKHLQIAIITPPQNVLTVEEKNNLLQRYHNDPISGGHIGQKRLYAKLRSGYYWKNMSKDVVKFVKNCEKCTLNKPKTRNIEPLQITETPQKPFDIVVIDTIGPFKKTINQNQYAVTIICDLTKYLVTVAIPNKEAKTIARAILENFILIYGPMKRILTDRGTEYKNQIIHELCQLLNINQVTSTAYHHETLGSIERNHRVLNEYLRAYINESYDNWEEYLKYFTYCHNTTPHISLELKYTPFELIFAKKANEIECLSQNKIDPVYNIENYSKEVKFRLQVMHNLAKQFLDLSKQRNKQNYDKNMKCEHFEIGNLVLLRKEVRHKFDPIYDGPFEIKEIKDANALIRDPSQNKEMLVHKNRLIKCNKNQ